jgi:trk system potassium uptake protein TrkH
MAKLTGSVVTYPARASLAWYGGLIVLGAALLITPWCRPATKGPISLLDAVFTSTSATCVTGLTVCSTEKDFSFFGQMVILGLIQLGGIGIMTVTTFVMFRLGGRQSLRQRLVITETLGADTHTDLRWILQNVILLTFLLEGLGMAALTIRELFDGRSLTDALWHAVFHSISAFCNAGFALSDESLIDYEKDISVNFVIGSLIITGGLGFPVLLDLRRNLRRPWSDSWQRFHIHTKFMLIGTVTLLLLGMISFLMLEWENQLSDVPVWKRPMVAMFQSITCRTAGFNTMKIGELTNASLFISILLMIIGAGPCSTAGGLKVSTATVLVVDAWATFRGQSRVNTFRRTIPREVVDRAMVTTMVFGLVAAIALTGLLFIEQFDRNLKESHQFIDGLFEVVSALGTVGLSTGITEELNGMARSVLIVLMLIGRLGPITVFVALSQTERKKSVEYPNEEPMIG